jgi:catechol 2,3-dioxygenase-like lactoylglutathione lyase family enzyme
VHHGLAALIVAAPFGVFSQQPAADKQAAADKKPADARELVEHPAQELRKPGFLFLELNITDYVGHIKFFEDVTGYKLVRNDGGFAILQTDCGEILLNDLKRVRETPANRIATFEIGLVVKDLDAAFAAAQKHPFRITSKIQKQPWGVRDFRVLTPDGVYLRITE